MCAAHIDENHLCASDVCNFCTSIECNFAYKCAQCDFPVKCAPTLGHHVEEIHVEMQLSGSGAHSQEPQRVHNGMDYVCTNVNVVYSSSVGQMCPRITNLSDSKHALVDV